MDKKFYVPFKTAKLLKEKGYPQDADMYFNELIGFGDGRVQNGYTYDERDIASPTYHEVIAWLDSKGIYIQTEYDEHEEFCNWCGIIEKRGYVIDATPFFSTREEALNDAILFVLNQCEHLIKTERK